MADSGTIETPRLRIEPFTERFSNQRHVDWLNNPEITRYSGQRLTQHTLESCRAYMRSFDGTANYFWALVLRDDDADDKHIGSMNAYVNEVDQVADVGILVGERVAQGKGYAKEAWLGVCDYLLRIAGIRKVTAGTITPNIPMLKIMERTGMMPDGTRFQHVLLDGEEVDVVHAAFFRDAWLQRHPQGPFAEHSKTHGGEERAKRLPQDIHGS